MGNWSAHFYHGVFIYVSVKTNMPIFLTNPILNVSLTAIHKVLLFIAYAGSQRVLQRQVLPPLLKHLLLECCLADEGGLEGEVCHPYTILVYIHRTLGWHIGLLWKDSSKTYTHDIVSITGTWYVTEFFTDYIISSPKIKLPPWETFCLRITQEFLHEV